MLFAAASTPVLAQPLAVAGPPGASSCSGCHAVAASGSRVPAIDGLSAREIAAAMDEYRTGRRPATVMDRIAKGFTPAESEAISAFLAHRPEAGR